MYVYVKFLTFVLMLDIFAIISHVTRFGSVLHLFNVHIFPLLCYQFYHDLFFELYIQAILCLSVAFLMKENM